MTTSRGALRAAARASAIIAVVAASVALPRPVGAVVTLVANGDSLTTTHDRVAVVAAPGVLANDITILGTTAILDAGPTHGTVQLAKNGGYHYTPNARFVGADSFSYHDTGLIPSNSAVVKITVKNAAPVAVDDAWTMTAGGTLDVPASGVLTNDTDADGDSLSARLVDGGGNGSLSVAADGSFRFKPGGSFTGKRTFTYDVTDGIGRSAVATVTIDVRAAAPSPTPTPKPTPTPTPAPTPTPTPQPTPKPTPTRTPAPTVPLPSLPLPSLPLPTLPVPTLRPPTETPVPTRSPAVGPSSTPDPTSSVGPTSSDGRSPSPGVGSERPGPSGDATPFPGAAGGPTSGGSGGTGSGGTGGSGTGTGGTGAPRFDDDHLSIGHGRSIPIDGLADVDVVGLDGLVEWAVPSLVLGVPGLLVVLAVIAQAVGGSLWLPFVRRWLGGFGLRRRPMETAGTTG